MKKNIVYTDEGKIKKLKLDEKKYPDKAALKEIEDSTAIANYGDTDGDGDIDMISLYGARSFTIWNENIEFVYDSGDAFEKITAKTYPEYFNASNDKDKFDDRSKSKGPEPEGVVIGEINGKIYAFILLERIGGIMVFDVTDPKKPVFIQYINTRKFGPLNDKNFKETKDLGPEGAVFIPADKSPNGKALLVVANEISGTVTVFEIK